MLWRNFPIPFSFYLKLELESSFKNALVHRKIQGSQSHSLELFVNLQVASLPSNRN